MNSYDTNPDHHGQSINGVVYKKTSGSFTVRVDKRAYNCALSPRLRKSASSEDLVAVGDHVQCTINTDTTGQIIQVLPRQNKLSRRSPVPMPGAHAAEQVIVANVDQVIPVFAAAQPEPRWNLLDRYLITAEAHELPALICITKSDLIPIADQSERESIEEAVHTYRQIGYPVILVSAINGEGLEELQQALRGQISVLLGKSGVGKTSLLNAIQPGLGLRVNAISSANGKGKHTTTHMEMFSLDNGGDIVDTPGVREFGLWDMREDELAAFFPEMRPFIGRCKFGMGCHHDEEPGCAIRKAVMAGQIHPRRYQSYMRLKMDSDPL